VRYEEERILASSLMVGDTLRTVCPKCRGGESGEASFAITKDDEGVVFVCFRAKCSHKGRLGGKPKQNNLVHTTIQAERTEAKRARAEEIWERRRDLNDEELRFLDEKFGYPVVQYLYCEMDPVTNRYLTPMFSEGKMWGFISRRFYEHDSPKALIYRLRDECPPVMALPGRGPMVIVEDVFSMGAMNDVGLCAATLCGTDTTEQGWTYLAGIANQFCNGHAVIMLDADATDKAFLLRRKHRLMFKDLGLYVLTGPDPKDMSYEKRGVVAGELMRSVDES
jgi:hypothetical protein